MTKQKCKQTTTSAKTTTMQLHKTCRRTPVARGAKKHMGKHKSSEKLKVKVAKVCREIPRKLGSYVSNIIKYTVERRSSKK